MRPLYHNLKFNGLAFFETDFCQKCNQPTSKKIFFSFKWVTQQQQHTKTVLWYFITFFTMNIEVTEYSDHWNASFFREKEKVKRVKVTPDKGGWDLSTEAAEISLEQVWPDRHRSTPFGWPVPYQQVLTKYLRFWAVVVVQWSASSPSTTAINSNWTLIFCTALFNPLSSIHRSFICDSPHRWRN